MRVVALLLAGIVLAVAPVPSPSHLGLPFYGPDNIVVDARGDIFVTDSDHRRNFRVIEFTSGGAYVTEWHVFRVAPAPSGAEGIAIDRRGQIFVTDAGAHRVLELSASGKVLAVFGGNGIFVNPGHVAVDERGFVYVSDAAANAVTLFSPDGRIVESWRLARANGRGEYAGVESIALSPRGTLYAEDWRNHRILELRRNSAMIVAWRTGSGDDRVAVSAGIAVDRSGRVYVADWGRHRIQIFGPVGAFLETIANRKNATPRFVKGPTSVYVDGAGRVYYADGDSVRVLDATGRLIRVIG